MYPKFFLPDTLLNVLMRSKSFCDVKDQPKRGYIHGFLSWDHGKDGKVKP